VRAHGSARDAEIDCRRKSGEIRNVSISVEPIVVSDEPCLLLIVRDITERKRTEEALHRNEQDLRESHARIEDLAGRLIVAQEEERKLLARELHDDVSQQLAMLAIGLSHLKQRLSDADAGIQEQIATFSKATERLSERIRKMSHELHSTVLQHVGLAAALSSYCEEFSSREGITIRFDIREGVDAVPAEAALCLYRVAQESLRNIAKHSRARSAVVELSQTRDAVELRVSDQGVGFDPGQLRESRGLGLLSMEERVKLLHGSLEFAAHPGAGTELKARIPLRTDHGQAKGPVG
jgi:signal transduction histidine kinase